MSAKERGFDAIDLAIYVGIALVLALLAFLVINLFLLLFQDPAALLENVLFLTLIYVVAILLLLTLVFVSFAFMLDRLRDFARRIADLETWVSERKVRGAIAVGLSFVVSVTVFIVSEQFTTNQELRIALTLFILVVALGLTLLNARENPVQRVVRLALLFVLVGLTVYLLLVLAATLYTELAQGFPIHALIPSFLFISSLGLVLYINVSMMWPRPKARA